MPGNNGETVSRAITDSYDVLYGQWPEKYNEIVLVLNENNGIPAGTLYQLGLITKEEYDKASKKIEEGKDADEISFDYEDICGHTFYLVPACDHYVKNKTALSPIWRTARAERRGADGKRGETEDYRVSIQGRCGQRQYFHGGGLYDQADRITSFLIRTRAR